MSPEAQRIAIAEACGWTLIEHRDSEVTGVASWLSGMNPKPDEIAVVIEAGTGEARRPNESDYGWETLPDYPNDLNAMHEALRVFDNYAPLTRHEWWQRYFGQLSVTLRIPFDFMPQFTTEDAIKYHHATAAQRAEAFLRTLNLWDDSK